MNTTTTEERIQFSSDIVNDTLVVTKGWHDRVTDEITFARVVVEVPLSGGPSPLLSVIHEAIDGLKDAATNGPALDKLEYQFARLQRLEEIDNTGYSKYGERFDERLEELNRMADENTPPDTRNRWAQQLGAETTYDAAKLLAVIRPEVEKILIVAGFTSPPSQSVRVRACLEVMHARLSELIMNQGESSDPQLNMKQRFELQKTVNALEAFQAVHKTITLCEGTVI